MKKISWCKQQKQGIKLVEPNDNVSQEYFQSAEESLRVLRSIKDTQSKMWLATTKYYIEYFAFYAVLMKLGIKCEIHECTIALADFFEKENVIPKGTAKTLEEDKGLRIDNQYYLKNRDVPLDFEKLAEYLLSIKTVLEGLTMKRIDELRKKVEDFA